MGEDNEIELGGSKWRRIKVFVESMAALEQAGVDEKARRIGLDKVARAGDTAGGADKLDGFAHRFSIAS
jgi:hypothetical protein